MKRRKLQHTDHIVIGLLLVVVGMAGYKLIKPERKVDRATISQAKARTEAGWKALQACGAAHGGQFYGENPHYSCSDLEEIKKFAPEIVGQAKLGAKPGGVFLWVSKSLVGALSVSDEKTAPLTFMIFKSDDPGSADAMIFGIAKDSAEAGKVIRGCTSKLSVTTEADETSLIKAHCPNGRW